MKNKKKKVNKNVEAKVIKKPFVSSFFDAAVKHIAIREFYDIVEPYIDILKDVVINIF